MIGEKHARLLAAKFGVTVYTLNSRNPAIKNIEKNLSGWDEAKKLQPDFIVISNATDLHFDSIRIALELNCPIFLEKPVGHLWDGFDDLLKEVKRRNSTVYVAYCLRFNPVIEFFKTHFISNTPQAISIRNSNNLTCWPRSIDKSYSESFEKGGGIVLDLSHEIDYLHYLSPIVSTKYSCARKNGNVTLDAPDYLVSDFRTTYCDALVELNYHGHVRERMIKVDFENYTAVGDLRNHRIEFYRNLQVTEVKNFEGTFDEMYIKQWDYFFKNMHDPALMNNLEEASEVFSVLCQINQRCAV